MPELPEVETIKKQITPYLPCKVVSITYSDVSGSIVKEKSFSPKGKELLSIKRQGKVLLFNFEQDLKIISGLGMSGSWRISPTKIKEKHTHVQIKTCNSKGEVVFFGYIDPRRFGNMHFLTNDEANKWLTRLGEDVSTKEFTAEYIYKKCQRYPNKKIKAYLLEQNHFAGVGNYMASEICARAKVLPERIAGSISKRDAKALLKATQTVLDDAIKTNGTTFSGGYQDAFGEKGAGVQNLVVFYQDTCKMCNKTKVKKIILAGRGTYYCPACQK